MTQRRAEIIEGATFYDADRQCRVEYLNGAWHPVPDEGDQRTVVYSDDDVQAPREEDE
jgi:hypothetical protein